MDMETVLCAVREREGQNDKKHLPWLFEENPSVYIYRSLSDYRPLSANSYIVDASIMHLAPLHICAPIVLAWLQYRETAWTYIECQGLQLPSHMGAAVNELIDQIRRIVQI